MNSTAPANPPWGVVRYKGRIWDRNVWNYVWVDYGGPPQVFLTRKRAEDEAKAFRKQYGGKGEQFGNARLIRTITGTRARPLDAKRGDLSKSAN